MKKWMIAFGENLRAAEYAAAAVAPYMEYVPVCNKIPMEGYNTITLEVDPSVEGVSIFVSEAEGEEQYIRLAGHDDIHLLYAISDFKNIYLPYARTAPRWLFPYYFNTLFSQPMKPYSLEWKPKIKNRGIWLWGHTMYDYRRFLDNMLELKLNTLIVWNDHLPINIVDVIQYAHNNGIKVFLGFAWGWDVVLPKELTKEYCDEVAKAAVNTFENHYLEIPCDGIYFQTFTEHMPAMLNGVSVMECAVKLANAVAERILELRPALKIQFGLHAGPALEDIAPVEMVDPRMDILWEDVGAFPYHYLPTEVADFEKTLMDNDRIIAASKNRFGAVLKGVICLDWGTFCHLDGPYAMGISNKTHTKEKLNRQRDILRLIQAGWLKNAEYAQKLIQRLPEEATITCLVEDGVLEEAVNFPTAMYASLLWDSGRPIGDIMYETALRQDVEFV